MTGNKLNEYSAAEASALMGLQVIGPIDSDRRVLALADWVYRRLSA